MEVFIILEYFIDIIFINKFNQKINDNKAYNYGEIEATDRLESIYFVNTRDEFEIYKKFKNINFIPGKEL